MNRYHSLDHELASRGWLSLNKALQWLKEYHPASTISYPTALKMISAGKINAERVGSTWRLSKRELDGLAAHGILTPSEEPTKPSGETTFIYYLGGSNDGTIDEP